MNKPKINYHNIVIEFKNKNLTTTGIKVGVDEEGDLIYDAVSGAVCNSKELFTKEELVSMKAGLGEAIIKGGYLPKDMIFFVKLYEKVGKILEKLKEE